MTVVLHVLFCDQLPLCRAATNGRRLEDVEVVSCMSIEVHHWLDEPVLILASVVRRRCEIDGPQATTTCRSQMSVRA